MAKFTIPQVESNIDNKVTMKHLDVFKDYMTKMFNMNMHQITNNIKILKSAIEGEDRAISHLGVPHGPAAAAPLNPNKYDWYFNTGDKRFYMYVDGAWKEIASLGTVVDLSDYYTIEEANEWFLAGEKATLGEVKSLEQGYNVDNKDAKYLNIVGLADILKDQNLVDELFLGKFADELYYKNRDTIEYKDTVLDRTTLNANVVTNGTSVTYSTLIQPYLRIEQAQASFQGKFETNMSVEYQFISKGKALKFSGTRNQNYKWEHVEKYEGNFTREYIRFTGTGKLEVADGFVPGMPSTWRTQAMPYELSLTDLMDTPGGQAIVQFDFDLLPINGSKILKLDYQTSTQFIVERYRNFLDDIYERVSKLETLRNIYTFPIEIGGFNNVTLRYQPADRPGTMAVGDTFLIDIEPKEIATITMNDTMTVMLVNQANVGGDPTANFAAVEPFVFDIHKIQADKDAFKNVRHWDYFKNMVDKYYIVAKKARDVDGKIVWITDGWIPKPQDPGDMKLVSRVVPAAQVWTEFQTSKALEKLVYINAHNAHDIESSASAFWKDSNLRFDQEGRAVANVSSSKERQFILTNTGISIMEQGVQQRLKNYTEWDKFEFFELEGKAFVGYEAHQRDPDITTWVNVGIGHEDEVLGFTPTGRTKFVKSINKDATDKLYAPKMSYFGDKNWSTMTQVVSGERRTVILVPPAVSSTPVGNAIRFIFNNSNVGTAQDDDVMCIDTTEHFILDSADIKLKWSDVKTHVSNGDTMILEKLADKPWRLIGWVYAKNYDSKYEPRQYDYSSSFLTTSRSVQGANTFLIITQPADAPNTPIGATNKIKFKTPATAADTDQMTYGSDLIWIYKNATDIMTWGEIKDHIANEEKMIITHLDNGHWELAGWESKDVSPAIQAEIDAKLSLDLSNVDTAAKKTAFINGLKAIGIETSLFNEFKGVVATAPASPNNLDWYISSVDDTIHVYHNGSWHQIGAAAGGTTTLDKAAILNLLGLTDADITKLKGIQTDLDAKQDTLSKSDALTILGVTSVQLDQLKTLQADLNGKQDSLSISDVLTILGLSQTQIDALKALQTSLNGKQDTMDAAAILALLGVSQAQVDELKTLTVDLAAKQDTLDSDDVIALLGLTHPQVDALKTLTADLAAKQDTLTKTITLTFDDNTTEDIKVG